MHDGMPYGRIQGQGHEPIQGSRIENLQLREVDRQSPTGLIFISITFRREPQCQYINFGELVCRRVGLSASWLLVSWFVGELSINRARTGRAF